MVDGVLNDLSVAETVALLSCLLPNGFKAASRAPTGSQATAAAGANGGGGGGGRGLAGGGAAPPLPLPTEGLDRAVAAVNAAASRLSAVLSQCGLADASTREFIGVPHNSGVSGSSGGSAGGVGGYVSVELLPAVLAWANGATFEQCWLLSPSTFEGTLVRSLRSLDELLRQLGEAATALGDQLLVRRFRECSACIHRGIAFASSLYLQD